MTDAYRDRPTARDVTLWHGPFEGRSARALGALIIAVVLSLGLLGNEAQVFRSLVCERPGLCVIERGTDWYGVKADRRFNPASVVRVERGRSKGKNPQDYLLLVTDGDEQIHLFEGAAVARLAPRIRRFFDDRSETSLVIREAPDPSGRVLLLAFVAVAFALSVVFGLEAVRARARFRIEIDYERDLLRIERMAFGRPVDPIELSLASITDVVVQNDARGSKGGSRVLLVTNEGLDQPVTPGYFYGPAVATTAAEIREALRLEAR